MLREHAARPPRRAGGRRRSGTVPVLRRGLVHHGRSAARRRRTGDVMTQAERQRAQAGRHHRDRDGHPARQRRRDVVAAAARRRVRRGRDHALRPHRLPGPLRLRAEGLRPDQLDRPQVGAADGPLRADDPRGGPAGRRGLRDRHQRRPRAGRRLDRDRDRRPALVPGLLRHPQGARARTGSARSRSPASSRTWAPAGSRSSSARRGR